MHNCIVGASYSGKTWLAKRFALDALNRGQNAIAFDPLKSKWPDGTKCYSTVAAFLAAIEKAENAHVFVDECKVLFNEDIKGGERLLYQKRHQGLLVYLIGQRATGMMPPNARDQCSKLFAFKQSVEDADMLSKQYSQDILRGLNKMKKCEFFATDSYSIGKFRLDFNGGTPPTYKPIKGK